MAEKELRSEINEIVADLLEIKEELGIRLGFLKNKIKPFLFTVLGLIGLKIGLKLMKFFLALLWKLRLLVLAGLIVVAYEVYTAQTKKQG